MRSIAADPGVIEVVVGILRDAQDRVLLARRREDQPHPGKWEFPGGKIDAGEGLTEALARELREELGIALRAAEPLIEFPYRYPGRAVRLHVWQVSRYDGVPVSRERQALEWVEIDALVTWDLLEANRPVVHALQLPAIYAITDGKRYGEREMLARMERGLERGLRLVQVREKGLEGRRLVEFTRAAVALCRRYRARILVNGDPALVVECGADGIHLDSGRLAEYEQRPLPSHLWVAASCHDRAQLDKAARLEADFAVLSPVKATRSHPEAQPLGWERFRELCAGVPFPVYALGGMSAPDIPAARRAGGQGVAMLGAAWED